MTKEEQVRSLLDDLRRPEVYPAPRPSQGRVRDGHGDLRLEHVSFEGAEPIVDTTWPPEAAARAALEALLV